jgi:ABC-2 type transport system ATP-binding protein
VIVVAHLTRTFHDRTAVADVSFEVRRGEVFGLLGPNGAGKTTTLRMIGGLILPTSGEVAIDGTRIERANVDAVRRRIGFLTETPGLWEQLTVFDNLATYAKLFGVTHPVDAAGRMLRRFELWDRRDDRAALLSKGMKQKLAVARALVHDPEIVLLDEPTANLDPQTARGVRELVADLRDRGRAIIVSTHNLDEVERIATRVALISTRLIAAGEPAALRRSVFGRRLRVSVSPAGATASELSEVAARHGGLDVAVQGDTLTMRLVDPERETPAVVAALVGAGAAILSVQDDEQPLEEVYIRLLAQQGAPAWH